MQSHETAGYSCSVGDNLEKLYKDVFHKIYSHIKNQKKGVLSSVIYIILEQDKSQAESLCKYFKINSKSPLNNDLSISSDIIGLFISSPNDKKQWIMNFVKDGVNKLRKSIGNNLEDDEMKLYQIVVIGCLIVGVFACIKYLESKQIKPQEEDDYGISSPKQKIYKPAALCLVVPASVVGSLKNNNLINVSEIEEIIDKALYFLCTNYQDADANQQRLELVNKDISNASENTEVYVRINISDGEEMIGQTIPYILKKKLPPNGQYVVTELACLKYLSNSGLEKFNRV